MQDSLPAGRILRGRLNYWTWGPGYIQAVIICDWQREEERGQRELVTKLEACIVCAQGANGRNWTEFRQVCRTKLITGFLGRFLAAPQ